jgi:poly-gamma-glutamate biosynthesis protein PgsC/CapC
MDLLTISIGIGLVVSLFLSEVLGMAGAGLVVPGYLAIHLTEPLRVLVTMAAGVAAYLIVRGLSSLVIIFGRRRTVMMILVGYLMGMLARYVIGVPRGSEGTEYAVIGYIVPGLIAVWLDRRGIVESLSSLVTASIAVRLILILLFGGGIIR